jgi:rubrerythrin
MRHWTIDDLDWGRLDAQRARADTLLYYLVAGASFVETGAELYTSNLVRHFSHPALRRWLGERWQAEELQHGRALRRYVETAWPELDWPRAYEAFFAEYSAFATVEALEDEPALELVTRCVIETGTSTFYTALQRRAEEPVLRQLTGYIARDEVSHYRHFRDFLEETRRGAGIGRAGILRALVRRMAQVKSEDAYVGFKHAWRMRHPGAEFREELYARFQADVRAVVERYYPYRMAAQMLLRPLDLGRGWSRIALPLLEHGVRHAI